MRDSCDASHLSGLDGAAHPPGSTFSLSTWTEVVLWEGVMYVLCSLAVLTLHSLFKSWTHKGAGGPSEAAGREGRPEDGGFPQAQGASRPRGGGCDPVRSCRAGGKRRRGVPDSRKRVQVRRLRSGSSGEVQICRFSSSSA